MELQSEIESKKADFEKTVTSKQDSLKEKGEKLTVWETVKTTAPT